MGVTMSEVYILRIHKHTPKRYRMSKNKIHTHWITTAELAPAIYYKGLPTNLVTDITKKPEPMLDYKNYKGDWNKTLADMNEWISKSYYVSTPKGLFDDEPKPKKLTFIGNIKHHLKERFR